MPQGRVRWRVGIAVAVVVAVIGVMVVLRDRPRRTSLSVASTGAVDDGVIGGTTMTTSPPFVESTTPPSTSTVTEATVAPVAQLSPAPESPAPERCVASATKARTGDVIAVAGVGGLREIHLDSGEEHIIGEARAERAYVEQARWSPSGRFVAHVTGGVLRVTDLERDCTRDLVGADPARPDLRPLSWSDDERRVTFIQQAYAGAPRPWQVHVINADGTGRRLFLKANSGVVWAPDRSGRIAYCDAAGLKVLNERTGLVTMVHPTDKAAEFPEWSPDATRLVFSMSLDSGVWVASATGGGGRRITDSAQVFWSSWSPDGTQFAYAYGRELWVVGSDGADPHKLTSGAQTYAKPFWSADGRRIAFTDGPYERQRVMVVDADGTNLRMLAEGGAVAAFFRR